MSIMPQMQLDDENETLDWGNEEEEYQESARRLHAGGNAGDGILVGDDVEDTISLGDDEDDQRFYSLSRHDATNLSSSYNVPPASPPSSQSKSTASGANPAQLGHRSPAQGAHLSAQETPFKQETPQKKSAARHSPQRSLPRLTHALPPKPVAASATALAQPYPTVVAVTTITPISPHSAGRDLKDMNGKLGLSPPSADLPQDWESRCSRKGETYYYNRVTHECTWTLPSRKPSIVPSSVQDDSKSRPQRRSMSPGGNKEIVSFDSNSNRPQTSRPNLSRAVVPEIEERKRPLTPDANGLTFEDRHYRPGLNSVSMADGIRGFELSDISTSAGRYARSSSPRLRKPASPPSSERTKEIPRDQRSVQEKPTHAKTAPKLDSYRPDYDSRRWPPSSPPCSPIDYHARTQREHASYVTSEEDRMQVVPAGRMPGPSLRREDTTRDRHQHSGERDPPPARGLDVRDPSASQNYFTAQRSRSPAPVPRERDRDIRDARRESRELDHLYDGDPRHSERERIRQYERTHAPKSTQASGRERPIEPDVDPPRGRNSERERVRGDRSERDRDVHNPRREVNNGIDADQRSQGDTKSKRNVEDHDRKADELSSARSKRAPLPPQQTSFRSARLRDPPPPISTSSKRPEDKHVAVDDALPRQPRNSSSAVQSLNLSRPPNGADLHRFHDGPERQERPPIWDGASYSDKRANVIRDDSSRLERRQSGLTDRRLPEDIHRSSNIPLDSDGGRGPLRPRPSVNDNVQRDSKHDKLKNENPKEGSDRDVRPQFERNILTRGRDAPSQSTRLTGTNNIPIGNRRSVVAVPDPEDGPPATRKLPPGKESYERPPDIDPSNPLRQMGSSSRTESGKNRSPHDLRQPQTRHDDEARGRKPLLHPLEQHSNGSRNHTSTPLPLSRDLSGSILSVPGRLSTYPSSDGRSEFSFRANQNIDPPARSRGSYRQRDESLTRRDPQRGLRRLSHSPIQLPPDGVGPHSHHSSAGDVPPSHLRKSGGTGPDLDARFSSSADLNISASERSDFISRVEPPPLRRGGSLLDRLSMDNKDRGLSTDSLAGTSLRDRLVPSKRDRDEMMYSEASSGRGLGERPQDFEGSDLKRAKKRGGKRRSAGRRV